jgi:Ca2+-binding EF-hand superfamily protein
MLGRVAYKAKMLKNGVEATRYALIAQRYFCTSPVYSIPKDTFTRDYSKAPKPEQKFMYDLSSSSGSDSDFEGLGHKGESPFWRRKMRTFHGILDVNNDGVISYDDFKLLADRFIKLGHLSDKQKNEFRLLIKKIWESQWGEITPYNLVTVEQYIEDMFHVLNDKSRARRAHSFLPYLFKAVDKDNSGEISVQEYQLFFKCLGLNEEAARIAFNAIDSNENGKINIKEFIQHGREFFFTEDEERISKHFWGPLASV